MLSNGVYVMTARHGEQYGGATVTWLSQASFQPPLLMAAIRRDSNVFRCLEGSGLAAIHIIGADQRDMAQRFFTPTTVEGGSMNGEPFQLGRAQTPILENARAWVECELAHIVPGFGDHAVVLLKVIEAECRSEVQPMTIAESPWQYGG